MTSVISSWAFGLSEKLDFESQVLCSEIYAIRDFDVGILRSLQYIAFPSVTFTLSMIPRILAIDVPPMNSSLSEEQSARREFVRSLFDGIAPQYDFLNHLLSLGIDVHWRKYAIRLLKQFQPSRILDVATGTGDVALEAARTLNAEVIGIDISDEMLAIGRKKVKRRGLSEKISLRPGSAESLEFRDGTFDAVTVAFGARNFSDVRRGLEEMFRVLRNNGVALILEFSKPRMAVFRQIYALYFERVLPLVGGMFSKSRTSYEYLPQSVKEFPDDAAFLDLMHKAGFTKTEQHRLTFGIATVYVGIKQ